MGVEPTGDILVPPNGFALVLFFTSSLSCINSIWRSISVEHLFALIILENT